MTATATGVQLSYPGVLRIGNKGSSVKLLQARLNEVGCGPVAVDGDFGPQTYDAVELFQARSVDMRGMHLTVDGEVGSLTWGALFPAIPVPAQDFCSDLAKAAVDTAAGQEAEQVREQPPGSNRGPRVDQYIRSVGLDPARQFPWCAAFVYWCFEQAAPRLSLPNPVTRTGSVLEHWQKAASNPRARRLLAAECQVNPGLVQPGMIFVLATGAGAGHTGLIESIEAQYLTTIEGNTNEGGSREGVGVFRRTSRKISQINRGFIAYR
ncbi:MAG TPA: peptidoglycan-binding protein [Terriglobales bacterium]|nr:peptidoglycan-binding protein [Terriglobales bacterium]